MMTCWDSCRELLVIADRPATLDEADIIPRDGFRSSCGAYSICVYGSYLSKRQANVQLLLLISNTS